MLCIYTRIYPHPPTYTRTYIAIVPLSREDWGETGFVFVFSSFSHSTAARRRRHIAASGRRVGDARVSVPSVPKSDTRAAESSSRIYIYTAALHVYLYISFSPSRQRRRYPTLRRRRRPTGDIYTILHVYIHIYTLAESREGGGQISHA